MKTASVYFHFWKKFHFTVQALDFHIFCHYLPFCRRNGIPVRPNGHNIQMSPDGSLILNNVKPSDEGTYTCNAYTGIYSVSATAEVRVAKGTQQGGKQVFTSQKLYYFCRNFANLVFMGLCILLDVSHDSCQDKKITWKFEHFLKL